MTTPFLTDPILQLPGPRCVHVVWFTSIEGEGRVITGDAEFPANVTRPSRLSDDAHGRIEPVTVYRHEAVVSGLAEGARVPYRVEVTVEGTRYVSDEFTLSPALPAAAPARLMLAGDHQLHPNASRAMELAATTFGLPNAVVFAGDLANVPDRASEWFTDAAAFFPSLQGRANAKGSDGRLSPGAALLQHTPLFPCIGNHEVQGRIAGNERLAMSSVPRAVAEAACPDALEGSERERWIEDNSWSTRTYEELFTLPYNPSGHSRWYATTIGNVRLITLFHTRQWRGFDADPDPAKRRRSSRYQEAADVLASPLLQGHGCHLFSDIGPGSEQFEWLRAELASPERSACQYTVVQLHEGAHGWGGNVEPPFCEPERIEERDDAGALVGVRYEYDTSRNAFYTHVVPMLEQAGVQLVYSGHSHVWNRFEHGGTVYLEASNTGRTHGIHDDANPRPLPPAPWRRDEYTAVGNPYGLAPAKAPYGDSEMMNFTLFDGATGRLESWRSHVDGEPELYDVVTLTPSR